MEPPSAKHNEWKKSNKAHDHNISYYEYGIEKSLRTLAVKRNNKHTPQKNTKLKNPFTGWKAKWFSTRMAYLT